MANVLFSRTDSPSTKPITDGQIIFDTSGNGKMYLDNGTTRLEMGGAINVDATLDATSTNPIQNKGVAGVMLSELEEVRGVTKKGFLTDALATKTLDAKIGTTDISSIGDGTVTGAISDINGKLQYISNNVDISNGIDLITYTDKNNPYICQTDGFIQCASSLTYNTKYYINLYVNGFMVFSLKGNGAESSSMTWRVFKGDKIYVTMNNYSGTYGPWVTLYPLK